jgi:hypothetical protein
MSEPIQFKRPWPATSYDKAMLKRLKLIRTFVAQLLGSEFAVPTLDEFIEAAYQAYLFGENDPNVSVPPREYKEDDPRLQGLDEEKIREYHRPMYEFMYPAAKEAP